VGIYCGEEFFKLMDHSIFNTVKFDSLKVKDFSLLIEIFYFNEVPLM